MSTAHELRTYDYVNHPYARVRDALLANPHYVFRHATAASDTQSANLHIRVGAFDIGADIEIAVHSIENVTAYGQPATNISLVWQALRNPGLFPLMNAKLTLFPLSSTETQLELVGTYDPPMGKLGDAVDAVAFHRIAESSVKRFISEVAGWLREELAVSPPVAVPDADQPGAAVDTEC